MSILNENIAQDKKNADQYFPYWEFLMRRIEKLFHKRLLLNGMVMFLNVVILCALVAAGSIVSAAYRNITCFLLISFGMVLCFVWRVARMYVHEILVIRASTIAQLEQLMPVSPLGNEINEAERKNSALSATATSFPESKVSMVLLFIYIVALLMYLSGMDPVIILHGLSHH